MPDSCRHAFDLWQRTQPLHLPLAPLVSGINELRGDYSVAGARNRLSERGIIRRKTKLVAVFFLAFSLAVSLFMLENTWYEIGLAATYAVVLLFILTRPSE